MTVRLNGWQRLWIVLSVLYLLSVIGLTMALWPTPETTRHRDELLTRMPPELRARVLAAYESEWTFEEAWKKIPPPPDAGRKASKGLYLTPFGSKPSTLAPLAPGVTLFSEPVSFPNGAVLEIQVAKEGDPAHDARVAAAYWAAVEAAARAERWTRLRQMALVWVTPCMTLYALGWATAWVRRGFGRRDPPQ